MSGNQWYTGHDDTFAYPEGEMGGTTTLAAPFLGGSENRTKYGYDNWRDVVTVTDPRGKVTTYTRTADRLVASIQPPASPGCGTNERRDSKYDPNNSLVYSDVGANTSEQRFAAYRQYDRLNRVMRVKRQVSDAVSVYTDTSYDGLGRVVVVTGSDGQTTRTAYSEEPVELGGALHFVTRTSASGTGVSEFPTAGTWTDASLRTFMTRTEFGGSAFATRWFAYDAFGRQDLTVTSPATGVLSGATYTFYADLVTRDKNGSQIAVERGEAALASSPAVVLDKTQYTYKTCVEIDSDELGRGIRATRFQDYVRPGTSQTPTTATGAIVSLTQHSYDGRVLIQRRVLPSAYADTTYEHDNISRVKRIIQPDGQSSIEYEREDGVNLTALHSKDYDPLDSPVIKDYIARYYYDDQNRVTKQTVEGYDNVDLTDPFQSTTTGYDFRGNVNRQAVLDQTTPGTELVVNESVFDGLNRLVYVTYDKGLTGHLNVVNQVLHDDAGRTVTRRDGENQDTVYTFHKALDVVSQIAYANYAETGKDRAFFSYDSAGRLVNYAAGVEAAPPWEITYTYDKLGRVTNRTITGAQSGEEEAEAAFAYDYQSRVLSGQSRLAETPSGNWDSTVSRTYNSLFPATESQSGFLRATAFTASSQGGYDCGGRRIQLQYPKTADYLQTRTLQFYPDALDRLVRIEDGTEGTLATYAHAGAGERVRRLSLYAAEEPEVRKDVTYDHLCRPTVTAYARQDDVALRSYTEGWGDGESVASPVFSRVSLEKSGTLERQYAYDGLNRLVTVTVDQAESGYGYDLANNRTWKDLPGDPPTPDYEYAYNPSNEIETGTGFANLAHDSRGNLVSKVRVSGTDQAFAYDKLNRLVSYDPSVGDTWRYFYDAFGRRVLKKKEDNSQKRYSYYDDYCVILEVVEGTGAEAREYIYGNGIDEVLVEHLLDPDTSSVRRFWPLVDSLGTVRDLADLDGSSVARLRMSYDIDAEGNLQAETLVAGMNAVVQDVLYTGRWIDRETAAAVEGDGGLVGALYDYRAREYDPELQRFVQRDPIGVWGDDWSLGNGYAVAGNDVTNLLDPFGLEASALTKECKGTSESYEAVGWADQYFYRVSGPAGMPQTGRQLPADLGPAGQPNPRGGYTPVAPGYAPGAGAGGLVIIEGLDIAMSGLSIAKAADRAKAKATETAKRVCSNICAPLSTETCNSTVDDFQATNECIGKVTQISGWQEGTGTKKPQPDNTVSLQALSRAAQAGLLDALVEVLDRKNVRQQGTRTFFAMFKCDCACKYDFPAGSSTGSCVNVIPASF